MANPWQDRRGLRVVTGGLISAVGLALPPRMEVDPEVADLAMRTPWTYETAERVVSAWRAHPGPETLGEYADAVMGIGFGSGPPRAMTFGLHPDHPPHRPGGRWHRHLPDGRIVVVLNG